MEEHRPSREEAEAWLAAFGSALEARERRGRGGAIRRRMLLARSRRLHLERQDAGGARRRRGDARSPARDVGPTTWRIDGQPSLADSVVEAWIAFETRHARGRGILRLKDGRAWTLLTAIEELKGFEERKGRSRRMGVNSRRLSTRQELAGGERAEEEALGKQTQPYCVIVGGGQGGIALGARLKQLDVPTIVLEMNARAGNSWRNRYRSLVLHDPVWYDHLPYIPFPENWPVFTPKDKLGDWLEMYAKVMELDYWGSSECVRAPLRRRERGMDRRRSP